MSYNNQSQEKQLPTVEYSLKNISWHLKVISDQLGKLIEMQGGQPTGNHPSSQNYSNQNTTNYPF